MWIEDYERAESLDQLWLLEKQNEMYEQWEQWELNHNPQLVAEIRLLTPIFKSEEL